MSPGARINESWYTYEWVMVHVWMSHDTHMQKSWHTYKAVMSRIRMSYVTSMNESCNTYKRVMSRKLLSHVTHMNGSRHIYEWAMAHTKTRHVTYMMSHITHINTHTLSLSLSCTQTHTHTHTHMYTHSKCTFQVQNQSSQKIIDFLFSQSCHTQTIQAKIFDFFLPDSHTCIRANVPSSKATRLFVMKQIKATSINHKHTQKTHLPSSKSIVAKNHSCPPHSRHQRYYFHHHSYLRCQYAPST